MAKMSDSAMVKMNAALRDAPTCPMTTFRKFDLGQAATYALQEGVAAIDERGLWRVRLEDPRTADEEKRTAMVEELARR